MRKIIINADDCGISDKVDAAIEMGIVAGKITSTTIMANMNDFDGAVKLYKLYKDSVSFGWHINLDEGEPLTQSQLLLDRGFFVEKEGKIQMNGMNFCRSFMDKPMREEIKKELTCQFEKLQDNGIHITHADSHHYIHTQKGMIQVIPSLFKELKIKRCRRIYNYGFTGINGLIRTAWAGYYKIHGIRMPDTFAPFSNYEKKPFLKQGEIIELMVHPGHPSTEYYSEFHLLLQTEFTDRNLQCELITYKEV